MEQPAITSCAACGKTQQEVRKLIAVGGPTLCDGCIHAYGVALRQALDEDSRARAGESMLIAAEEMALDLIDALESTRAEQAERELEEEIEQRARKLRLVEVRESIEPEPEPDEPRPSGPDDFPSEAEWAQAEEEAQAEAAAVQADAPAQPAAAESAPAPEPAASTPPAPESAASEPPRPMMRHCPWCTGNLEAMPAADGAQPTRFQCTSCGRQFDISQA